MIPRMAFTAYSQLGPHSFTLSFRHDSCKCFGTRFIVMANKKSLSGSKISYIPQTRKQIRVESGEGEKGSEGGRGGAYERRRVNISAVLLLD